MASPASLHSVWARTSTLRSSPLSGRSTRISSENPTLATLNGHALQHPKVTIVHTDDFGWLQQGTDLFDVIVVDFPDPTNFSIGKLYTNSFYALLDKRLAASGYAVVQTTSPLVARQSERTTLAPGNAVTLDIATDHALHVGLQSGARVIMSSPCCHKELRPQMTMPAVLRP
eukprot:gene47578-58286_t